MQITGWTFYDNKKFIDPDEERRSLWNPERKIMPPKEIGKDVKALEKWREENEKIPRYTDEKRAAELIKIYEDMYSLTVEHCKKTGIRFNANYHQGGEEGCPVFDDKYIMQVSLRTWGALMADVEDNDDPMGYVDYYLDMGEMPKKLPSEVGEKIYEEA